MKERNYMIYLIDFENVHEDGFASLGRLGEKDAVYCFFTKNVAKISMSALAGMRSGQLHFVEAESGKQSLDLALVSYLGYLIGTRPQEQCFEIISNDNGFSKVADFWNKRGNGTKVRVRKIAEQKQKAETGRNQASPQQAVIPQEPEITGSGNTSGSAEEEKPYDPAILSALSAAGINASTAEFLLTQTEKYRQDKNLKQLVYRAVVKKYGQKSGTQIYNTAKKILMK